MPWTLDGTTDCDERCHMPASTKQSPTLTRRASAKQQSPLLIRSFALWMLVFSTGWFVMLTELVGARVLAPYFGNSIYVWGSVIAIFMLALAVGYALGGRLTQRFSSSLVPSIVTVCAGLYVASTPLYQGGLSEWLYNTGMHVKWGSLLATIILYGFPMVLLGTVSPYTIQIATQTHSEAGSRAGLLYAVSTVGSFMGCLVTAFVLIPGMPLSYVVFGGGVAVALVAGVVAVLLSGRATIGLALAVVVAAVVVTGIAGFTDRQRHKEPKSYQYTLAEEITGAIKPESIAATAQADWDRARAEAAKYPEGREQILLEKETPYHHLSVRQNGPLREMIFGKTGFYAAQTVVDLRDIHKHVGEYTHLAFAGLLYRSAPKRVCIIGTGGAVIPRSLERCFPGVEIDCIDIDPEVIEAARKFFYWQPSSNVRMYAMDGRSFLNWVVANELTRYDWLILDAFSDNYVPFHLTTYEFFNVVKTVLVPGGVLAMNMFIDDDIYGYEARTIRGVFGNVSAFAGHKSGNIVLTAQKGRNSPLTLDEAGQAVRTVALPADSRIDLRYIMTCLVTAQNFSDEGPMLTDLWSPVENLVE